MTERRICPGGKWRSISFKNSLPTLVDTSQNFGPKEFGLKKKWAKKSFAVRKQFWVQKKNFAQKNFGPKNNMWVKMFWVGKKCLIKNLYIRRNFVNFFWTYWVGDS